MLQMVIPRAMPVTVPCNTIAATPQSAGNNIAKPIRHGASNASQKKDNLLLPKEL